MEVSEYMKNKLRQINNLFNEINDTMFVFIMLVLSFAGLIPLIPIFEYLNNNFTSFDMASHSLENSAMSDFIIAVIIAPIFETLVFQHILIKILQISDALKKNKTLVIIISALVFGLNHYYSVEYIFYAFSIGIILSYSYVLYQTKETKLTPFKVVFLIHLFRNLISFLLIRGSIFT